MVGLPNHGWRWSKLLGQENSQHQVLLVLRIAIQLLDLGGSVGRKLILKSSPPWAGEQGPSWLGPKEEHWMEAWAHIWGPKPTSGVRPQTNRRERGRPIDQRTIRQISNHTNHPTFRRPLTSFDFHNYPWHHCSLRGPMIRNPMYHWPLEQRPHRPAIGGEGGVCNIAT